jgi:formylglycine-generating enzyme required for sulfatase activity
MAPRLRPPFHTPDAVRPDGLRDYSRIRRLSAQKKAPRKSNFALFAQLFTLGVAFMLSFGYFSNSEFRQSVSNGFAAIFPALSPESQPPDAKLVSNTVDPFAPPDNAVKQLQLADPAPAMITVLEPTPMAEKPKPAPLPIAVPTPVQVAEPLPPPVVPKVIASQPVVMAESKSATAPTQPLPTPNSEVAAMEAVTPPVAVVANPSPAATASPAIPKPPAAVIVPMAQPLAAKPTAVAVALLDPLPAISAPVIIPPAPVVAAPAPVGVAPPLILAESKPPIKKAAVEVAQAVPPSMVQIPVPDKPTKIEERIEEAQLPVEKSAERLLPERTQGDVFTDCKNCPELAVVAATPDDGVIKATNTNFSGDAIALQPFAIGSREVTFDDWDRCVSDGGCKTQPSDDGWGRGQRPVIHVSFNDINDQYLPWLSRVSQHKYRLPTEAEWEFAARGGGSANLKYAYSFGDDEVLLCEYGNSSDLAAKASDSNWTGTPCNDGFATTAPVGSFKPNPLGIYDMHGNVWEWVSDCLRSGYSADPAKNAYDCNFRALRGGSWASPAPALRSSERGWEKPDKQKNSIGFRVARSLP